MVAPYRPDKMDGMAGWRAAGSFAVWATATALSAGLVWLGLQPVLRAAVPERVEVETGAALRDGPEPTPPPTPPAPTERGTPPAPVASSTTGTGGPATVTPVTPVTSGAAPTGRPAPAATVDGWTVVDEPGGDVSYLRRFEVAGGTTTIRMTPGQVRLVSATPKPGYTMDTLQGQPDRLVVRFWTASRIYTVDAIWWNDRPYAEVTEN